MELENSTPNWTTLILIFPQKHFLEKRQFLRKKKLRKEEGQLKAEKSLA